MRRLEGHPSLDGGTLSPCVRPCKQNVDGTSARWYHYGMERETPLGVRVQAGTKAAAERAARAEDRSLASFVDRVLQEWLIEHKWIELPKGKP